MKDFEVFIGTGNFCNFKHVSCFKVFSIHDPWTFEYFLRFRRSFKNFRENNSGFHSTFQDVFFLAYLKIFWARSCLRFIFYDQFLTFKHCWITVSYARFRSTCTIDLLIILYFISNSTNIFEKYFLLSDSLGICAHFLNSTVTRTKISNLSYLPTIRGSS